LTPAHKGTVKIKLSDLKSKGQISDLFPIELESKRCEPKLEVTITLRTPIVDKEYNITSKPVFTVTKTYPAFKGEGGGEIIHHPGTEKKAEDIQIPQMKPKQSVKPKEGSLKSKAKQPSNETVEKIDSSEFSKDELDDPDCVDNLNSMKVLEFKIDSIQKEIDKIEGRTPAALRQKLIKTKCKKNILEQQLGDVLPIDGYLQIMANQLKHDRKLAKYFEQEKMIEKGKKVVERMPILMKEIDEAIEYAKQNIGK
jgi:hypothetical protein